MQNNFFILIGAALIGIGIVESAEFAPGTSEADHESVRTFLDRHCMECHDKATAKAGLNLEILGANFLSEPSDDWIEIMDAINLGKMPPEDEPRPDAAKSFEVVKWIAAQLTHAEKSARDAGGPIPMRRVNGNEFANTVRDLLHLDAPTLESILEDLPGDGKAEGFDRLGIALFFDQTQIEKTLAVAEMIADLAIVDPGEKPNVELTRFEAENLLRPGGMGIRPPDDTVRNRYSSKSARIAAGPPTHFVEKEGVRLLHGEGNSDDLGRIGRTNLDELVPEDGYYRIRVRCGAVPGTRGDPVELTLTYNERTPQEVRVVLPVPNSITEPDVLETVQFLRRGSPDQSRRLSLSYNDIRDYHASTPEAQQFRKDSLGTAGLIRQAKADGNQEEVARLTKFLEETRERALHWKGPAWQINPKYADVEPPQFYIDWMEIEGPLKGDWPPKSHQELFFDGDKPHDLKYAEAIIARFLPRAYRRPVKKDEIDRVVRLIGAELEGGKDFYAGLRVGLARILASPGFVFLAEPSAEGSRRINDHELASRLSYFLWSTMPDNELFELAGSGHLANLDILKAQVSRMLADPRSREFVENFSGQWLGVREFGSVMPAEQIYREYDVALEEASKLEAYAFFEEILRNNLPITNFLDSDFVTINERLALHYGIDDIVGSDFRRIALKPGHHRGGVFGMAGLMTLLADGTRTLPVRRAAWVMENLFNDPPPPPPPNAGEVQPNTRGVNLTVRERLELHRDEPTCASSHERLDPYGLALENYDAIGKWRTKQNGEGFRANKAPDLVIEGKLPGGPTFTSLEEFKAALVEDKDRFARAFSERMLTYALGRPVGFSDRETIAHFVTTLQDNDYRIQPLIEAITTSEAFQTK